ncbi:MAG: YicC family protein [Omnitrophica WOR_2 bacterium RIFCSPLOWO2_12_FULL_51_8]|nr:MAG: YicC family protein [Omnitrophica WOR_2 bacterium RIFCSPLOWO2_12_FULL_51_8]
MTGFGSKEIEIAPFGKVSVELRSSNHKFFEAVFHLPEGLLSLEDKLKKEIETKIKRGRVTCAINFIGGRNPGVFINKALLKDYLAVLRQVSRQCRLRADVDLNTLVHLPGVLSSQASRMPREALWPKLKSALSKALEELENTRHKEGRALYGCLKKRAEGLNGHLEIIKARFQKAIREKLKSLNTNEERSSFLKNSDISEEIERLAFHIRNFKNKLSRKGPMGKELDFIAQEMQREANTLGAKSFDVAISSRVVQMKSQIEKIREQAQNIE